MDTAKLTLFEAYNSLSEARLLLLSSLKNIEPNSIWLTEDCFSQDNLVDAIDTLTRLCRHANKNDNDIAKAGFLMVPPSLIPLFSSFNKAKEDFKHAVIAFKGRDNLSNKVLDGNRRQLKKILDQALAFDKSPLSTLSGTSLADLDLKACYRKIKILDDSVTSINFIKEKKHLRTHRITRSQLHTILYEISLDGNHGPLLEFNKTSDTHFAIAKKTNERYMVNVTYSDPTRRADTFPVSGPIVSSCKAFPSLSLKSQQEKPRKRSGTQVDLDNKFIPLLSCYRYKTVN